MAEYLSQWHAANGNSGSFSVLPPAAGSYAGTADAVYQNLGYLDKQADDRVLILAGDHIYKMDYSRMLSFHNKVGADATVAVIRVPIEQAHRFGTVAVDAEGRIMDFVEKSSKPQSNLASMGIYIFNKGLLAERLAEDARKLDSPHDFGYAILPGMVGLDRVYAYEFGGYWQDIGAIDAYYQANMELLSTQPRFSLDSNWPILTETSDLTVHIAGGEHGRIVNSLIGPGCTIKGYVENSVISPGVYVEEKAEIWNSVVLANGHIGYHSVIDKCIVDEGVNVGKNCFIGLGASLIPGDWEVTVIGKEAAIPPHISVGRNCKICPGVNETDFTTAAVPSGTTILHR
jgi:glucose-1-phosphate adenylyltransferase